MSKSSKGQQNKGIEIKGNRFLVTGGTGFLGSHLVPLLITLGAEKVILYVRNLSIPEDIEEIFSKYDDKIEYFEGSLQDVDSLAKAAKSVNGIFHLAGQVVHSRSGGSLPFTRSNGGGKFPKDLFEVNVQGSINVMEAAAIANVRRVVIASTSGVVGCYKLDGFFTSFFKQLQRSPTQTYADLPTDFSPYCIRTVKHWPYYLSKIQSEKETLEEGIKSGVEVIWMRPSILLGPGDSRLRSTKLIFDYLHQAIPYVPNGGISIVDVRDAAMSFAQAMKKGRPYHGYLLSSYNSTIEEFFSLLSELSGVPLPSLQYIPDSVTVTAATILDWYNRIKGEWKPSYDPVKAEMASHFWSIDCSLAIEDLDFVPRDPKTTLSDTINYISQHSHNLDSKL